MRVLVSGSSGLIGSALRAHLTAAGHEPVALVRREPGPDERFWNPGAGVLDPSVFTGIDAVVNLNGVGVGDRRWTPERKELILDSRIGPTRLLADAMAALPERPEVFVSASAIGYYGDRGDEVLTEGSGAGPAEDFMVEVTSRWEAATAPAADAGVRTAVIRSGIVLDESGGALGRMLLPFKLGVGGRLGPGDQWWSWITIVDHVRAVIHLLDGDLSGPVNLTAPHPVKNEEFVQVLGSVLKRPTVIPVPRIALHLVLGRDVAEAVAFTSARVLPDRLTTSGFEWVHPEIIPALRATLGR